MKFKNHVAQHGKTLSRKLSQNYGDMFGLMEQALDTSNPEAQLQACQQLGQMNLEAQTYNDLAPQLKAAILNQITATTQYNLDQAEILKAAGKGSTQIEKAQSSIKLANSQYLHSRSENAIDFHHAKLLEHQRHNLEMSYIKLQGMIKQSMQNVDGQAKLINTVNQVSIKQIQEDRNYQKAVVSHLLTNGDQSRPEYIIKKDYTPASRGVIGFLQSIGERLGLFV
ncbi:hypothetical protein NIES2100_05150 [Calothrix sp. NIES-2100]|uniref:hypothetical protein n=1 Tax=Calothrix sp. NIES-2100 TaxID=1954172 RepID=UPI000B620A78|nr:hypothetical protein NIES2100_05150 [Calothrix sp. NIES-2100]